MFERRPWSSEPFGEASRTCTQVRNQEAESHHPLPVRKLPSVSVFPASECVKLLKNEARAKEEAENLMPAKGGDAFPGSQRREEDKKTQESNLRWLLEIVILSLQHADPGACWETGVPPHRTL